MTTTNIISKKGEVLIPVFRTGKGTFRFSSTSGDGSVWEATDRIKNLDTGKFFDVLRRDFIGVKAEKVIILIK